MATLFAATTSAFEFCPSSRKAKSALVRSDHSNAVKLGDGTFICAIELPSHFDAETFERLINECWAGVDWGYDRVLVRNGTDHGWIDYMLKGQQKSQFDGSLDSIILESLHNPIADA
jgi:hypothetical protein